MTISHGAWSYSIIKPSSASQAWISLSGLEQGWWGLAVSAKEKKKKVMLGASAQDGFLSQAWNEASVSESDQMGRKTRKK